MDRLEDLNGQQAAIDLVLSRQEAPKKEVIVVSGASGVGVTWTLERTAEAWEEAGGTALQARGEAFATERKLFPWLNLILPREKRLARLEVLKGSVAQGSRMVPVVGSFTSYLVEELLNHRKRRLAREAVILTEQEQDLLFVIQTAARRKRLLLTIDHLDVWDEASWTLLGLILSPSLDELYPSLADAMILVGSPKETPARLLTLAAGLTVTTYVVRPLERRDMRAALATFGLPPLARADMDALYDVTDGRLDLLHDLALHIRETGIAKLPAGCADFFDNIIDRRLKGIKGKTGDLEDLLGAAAVIGQTFAVDDIRCLTGHPSERLDASLRLATTERFLSTTGEILCFQSSALHRYFHRARAGEHARYHGKFAECLQTMRPAEYEYRVHHLALANRDDEALVCYALAALVARRQRRAAPEPGPLRDASDWDNVQKYLDSMYAAYEAYDSGHFGEGLEILDRIEDFLPDALIAERDYLEAQVLLRSHRIADFQRAATLLDRWRGMREPEAEVWSRIAQILMIALAETDKLEEARKLEAEVTTHYWSRRKVDPWALYGLNVLRRRAECLHHFPTATQRLESALAYFGPQDPEELPRHPVQYYYTLTNLVGNLIASGRFDDAYDRALELEAIVHTHPLMPWPDLEVAVNNFVLASHLSGNLKDEGAITLLEQVLKDSGESGDRILMENNYAVLLIRAGRQSQACKMLEDAYARVMTGGEPDPYHMYFVGNNLAALRALAGEVEAAESLRRESGRGLDRFYPAVRQTLLRRHELLAPVFAEAAQLGTREFDSYLMDHHPSQVGPQWAFYGRGFLLSDIQFWSAD